MADPEPHRWVHIERGDLVRVHPRDVGALVVDRQRPSRYTCGKAKRELLADFPVGERDDVGGSV